MALLSNSTKKTLSRFATKTLHTMDPETAHHMGMWFMKKKLTNWLNPEIIENLDFNFKMEIPGIGVIKHPIGLAGGFDKNGQCIDALARMGFSFLEVGTVTPLPQQGNPRPRIFRYPDQKALINRMGFPNHGMEKIFKQVAKREYSQFAPPLGVNIGKNRATSLENAIKDYTAGIEKFKKIAQFIVVNISSPNTKGLRELANDEFLGMIAKNAPETLRKIWIKLDPDMDKETFQKMVSSVQEAGFQGIILTNTQKVSWPEIGGRSGQPLASRANTTLEWAHEVHQGRLPIIASGGVMCGNDICDKIIRGACGVQIYTALVYRGPSAVHELLEELKIEMKRLGVNSLSEIQGSFY